MIQINQVQAIDEYDHNEEVNGQARYLQFIQARLTDGRVIELDFDRHMRQAILIESFEGGQRLIYRVATEVRGKDLIRDFYGIRRFALRNVWRYRARQEGDPRLMNLTFPEMYDRYELLQFDIIRPVQV
jgi:hypothetical protein